MWGRGWLCTGTAQAQHSWVTPSMIPMQGRDVLSERTYAGALHSWEESVQSVCWCFSPCVRVQYGRFQRTIGRLIKLSNHITPSPAITNRCGAEVDCAQARPKPSAAGCHHLWKAGTCCPKEHNVGSVPFLRSCCSKWLSVCFFFGIWEGICQRRLSRSHATEDASVAI